ncbi:transcriptional regulator, TetR family [Apibacter mensalis]|uniref:Transcriptional regulator, TetR family n=1 Tax=Apibacter mensalis TaxID=1586267 RepID=A0A0X3AM88_9FLAO|nr:TetR/AcrR family transcriptional regulator [Apibacter mensalis]CVK15444.1 transcriptional regulator, TetR family [Apibacter mensalis]
MDVIKDQIINKSIELFTQIGVKVVTMDMISKDLCMSKKTLYEHFSGKEDLIKNTFSKCISTTIQDLENKIKNCPNIIQQKFIILEDNNYFIFLKENQTLFQLKNFYPDIYIEMITLQNNLLKSLIKNNIILGIEEGLYRPKINKKLTVEYFYLFEKIIAIDDNLSKVHLNDNLVKKYFIELLIRSIATKKGIKELEKYVSKN